MNDDWKSLNWNAFLNRGIRISLRLTPKAQRKNRLVMRMNGATYRRSVRAGSVRGAELAMPMSAPGPDAHSRHLQKYAGPSYALLEQRPEILPSLQSPRAQS